MCRICLDHFSSAFWEALAIPKLQNGTEIDELQNSIFLYAYMYVLMIYCHIQSLKKCEENAVRILKEVRMKENTPFAGCHYNCTDPFHHNLREIQVENMKRKRNSFSNV